MLREHGGGPIKVGVAIDVMARIATLQTGNPRLLRLLHVVPGDQPLEHIFHHRLRGGCVHGEWFTGRCVDRFLTEVASLADRMVEAYDGTGTPPDYKLFGDYRPRSPRPPEPRAVNTDPRRGRTSVTVRYVDPSPRVPPEEAREMREMVRGLSPSLYLGPIHPVARKRISPNPQLPYGR